MKSRYRIFTDKGLLAYRIEGKSSLEALKSMFLEIVGNPDYKSHFKGLADWRVAESSLSMPEIAELVKFIEDQNALKGLWVALVSEPMMTARTMIFQSQMEQTKPIEICSTEARASELLGMDVREVLARLDDEGSHLFEV